MPVSSPGRQPDSPLAWFDDMAGQALLAGESVARARVLAACPSLPWAWIGLETAAPPPSQSGRGVLLRRSGERFAGAVHCALPLPLASETLGAVLMQHVLDDGVDAGPLFSECARVLAPGGTLWLTTLNPWSPYRARWARTGLRARDAGHWQAVLRRSGFAGDSISLQWLGPRWRIAPSDAGIGAADLIRAGIALTVSKRVHAVIPPARLRQLRWQTGLVPRDAHAASNQVASGQPALNRAVLNRAVLNRVVSDRDAQQR